MVKLTQEQARGNGLDAPGAVRPPTVIDYLQEALLLRGWGWTTFPIGDAKRPVVPWKVLQERRPTDRQISGMFDRRGVAGLAVVLGSASGGRNWGLCARDWDDVGAYERWAEQYPELAATLPTVVTPGRGMHAYCRLREPDLFVKLDDGELRASRTCYAILPPSRHPKGGIYKWFRLPVSLREFPVLNLENTGFLPRLPKPRRLADGRSSTAISAATSKAPSPNFSRLQDLPVAVREAVLRSLPHGEGERNGKLLYLARSLVDIEPAAPAGAWADTVFAWWQAALAVISTKDWATSWKDFVRAWGMVHVPISSSMPITVMTEAAVAAGPNPRDRVLAACRVMASISPTGRFHLAGRLAGKVAGIPHRTAAAILEEFVANRFLLIDKPGARGRRRRLATVYRLGNGMKGVQ